MSRKSVLGCVFFPINVGRLLPLVSFSFICGLHAQTQANLQSRTSFVPFLFCISSSPSRLQNDAAPILSASLCLSVFNMNLLSTSPVQRRKERFVVVFFSFSECIRIHRTTPYSNTTVKDKARWCSLVFQSCHGPFLQVRLGTLFLRQGLDDSTLS